MTTYSTITDGQVDQDSPITQPLMTALRDNLLAVVEGAAGAPRLKLAAIEPVAAGDVPRTEYVSQSATGSTTFAEVLRFGFVQSGSVRAYIEHTSGIVQNLKVERVRGGVTTVVASTAVSNSSLQVDVSVIHGDEIVLSGSGSGSGESATIGTSRARLLTDGGNLWAGAGAPVTGNAT